MKNRTLDRIDRILWKLAHVLVIIFTPILTHIFWRVFSKL